jgi:hypothetical protein
VRAPYEVRQNWRMAKRLRRAKRRLERALWRYNGYGTGQRFYGARFESAYHKASEICGVLETEARALTMEVNLCPSSES